MPYYQRFHRKRCIRFRSAIIDSLSRINSFSFLFFVLWWATGAEEDLQDSLWFRSNGCVFQRAIMVLQRMDCYGASSASHVIFYIYSFAICFVFFQSGRKKLWRHLRQTDGWFTQRIYLPWQPKLCASVCVHGFSMCIFMLACIFFKCMCAVCDVHAFERTMRRFVLGSVQCQMQRKSQSSFILWCDVDEPLFGYMFSDFFFICFAYPHCHGYKCLLAKTHQ